MASDVIDIRERIERVREAVENSAAGQAGLLAEAQAAASNGDVVQEQTAAASLAADKPVRARKNAAPKQQDADPQQEETAELTTDESIQALQLERMVNKVGRQAQASDQLADQTPSIKLNIRSQRINKLLMVMLAVQIASNLALIYLVYQLQA
jgi:hypothetical protein